MIVRPVTSADLPALIELARSTGTGPTGHAVDVGRQVGLEPVGLAV
ncbi:hypothetical protein ACLBVW_25030, partial [Pseudomonas aeruginosa]